MEILPGWQLNYDEVSNGAFKFLAIDNEGRKIGITESDFQQGINICKQYSFNIEKQSNKDFRTYLFDLFLLELKDKGITRTLKNQAYGTWIIEDGNKSIAYEGRDDILSIRLLKSDKSWSVVRIVKFDEFTFDMIAEFIDLF